MLQLMQLTNVHAHWTASVEAAEEAETGPRISSIAVDSHRDNVHLTCESSMFHAGRHIVPKDAIAVQCHDRSKEVEALSVATMTPDASVSSTNLHLHTSL